MYPSAPIRLPQRGGSVTTPRLLVAATSPLHAYLSVIALPALGLLAIRVMFARRLRQALEARAEPIATSGTRRRRFRCRTYPWSGGRRVTALRVHDVWIRLPS